MADAGNECQANFAGVQSAAMLSLAMYGRAMTELHGRKHYLQTTGTGRAARRTAAVRQRDFGSGVAGAGTVGEADLDAPVARPQKPRTARLGLARGGSWGKKRGALRPLEVTRRVSGTLGPAWTSPRRPAAAARCGRRAAARAAAPRTPGRSGAGRRPRSGSRSWPSCRCRRRIPRPCRRRGGSRPASEMWWSEDSPTVE